jgi:molybdopterin/thiamine biosynthesis adenylyltransferase
LSSKPPFEGIVVVGCGGIWSRLWLNLGDLSCYTEASPKSILLIDGDVVEEKNISRQGFVRSDMGKKKSDVYGDRMKRRYPELSIRSSGEFLTQKNSAELIPDRSVVVSCVDNNMTRLQISKHAQTKHDMAVIQGGNEVWDGTSYLYVRESGESRVMPMEEKHESVKSPKDKNPGEMSCEERLAQKGGEQILVTNAMVAAHMAAMFHDVLSNWDAWRGKEVARTAEVSFDVRQYCALGYVRRP